MHLQIKVEELKDSALSWRDRTLLVYRFTCGEYCQALLPTYAHDNHMWRKHFTCDSHIKPDVACVQNMFHVWF